MKNNYTFLVLVSLIFCVVNVEAADISVQPLLIKAYKGSGGSKKIVVKNSSVKKSLIQVDIFRWNRSTSEDSLEETRDVLISPRVFELPGGSEQVIRMVYQGNQEDQGEKAFRLLIREIPDALDQVNNGINVLLQISVPMFVNVGANAIPDKSWISAQLEYADKAYLTIDNKSNSHMRITKVTLIKKGGDVDDQQIFEAEELRYIFPGMSNKWTTEIPSLDTRYSYLANIMVNNHEVVLPINSN